VNRIYFQNLDALRTIACSAVIFEHTFGWYWKDFEQNYWLVSRSIRMVSHGEFGVFAFFMLSGFLITYLMLKEKETTGQFRVVYFYMRRALRIWPVYFLVLAIALLVSNKFPSSFGLPAHPIEQWWQYFVFTGNFDVMKHSYEGITALSNKISRITWSVAIEEQFYLIWPIILILSKNRFLHAILGVLVIGLFSKIYFFSDKLFYFHSLSGFYFLALGSFGGYITYKYSKHLKGTLVPVAWKLALYLGLLLTLFLLPDLESNTGTTVVGEILFSCFFLFILIDQTILAKPLIRLSKIPFLEFIGKYTYGMYLYHALVILFFRHFTQWKMTQIWQPFAECVIVFGITLVLAMLSYRFLESPFLRLKENFSLVKSGRNK
jgi:peptidoglycan/LPS O-acetylase OafA/YrhL